MTTIAIKKENNNSKKKKCILEEAHYEVGRN